MIAVISDIHGNFPALQSVLEKIHKLNCDRIISLGDVAGYYCMINECIELLRKNSVLNLMGNHDWYLVNSEKCNRSMTANLCLDYQKNNISIENYNWLSNSPPVFRNGFMWAVHGGWKDYLDEYVTKFDFEKFFLSEEKIFCSGHTHVPFLESKAGKTYFNPGSVGQPRDGNPNASFAIITDTGKVELYREKYDIAEIEREMVSCGLPRYVCDCLYYGEKIGGLHTKY